MKIWNCHQGGNRIGSYKEQIKIKKSGSTEDRAETVNYKFEEVAIRRVIFSGCAQQSLL